MEGVSQLETDRVRRFIPLPCTSPVRGEITVIVRVCASGKLLDRRSIFPSRKTHWGRKRTDREEDSGRSGQAPVTRRCVFDATRERAARRQEKSPAGRRLCDARPEAHAGRGGEPPSARSGIAGDVSGAAYLQQPLPQQPACSAWGTRSAPALTVQQPSAWEAPASQQVQRHALHEQVPLSQHPQHSQAVHTPHDAV